MMPRPTKPTLLMPSSLSNRCSSQVLSECFAQKGMRERDPTRISHIATRLRAQAREPHYGGCISLRFSLDRPVQQRDCRRRVGGVLGQSLEFGDGVDLR